MAVVSRKRVHAVYAVIIVALLMAAITGGFEPIRALTTSVDQQRASLISLKTGIQQKLIPRHGYRCCLDTPCMSCIEEAGAHGHGATCDCLSDIVNGAPPCGECVGGILAGRGNPYLVEFYPGVVSGIIGQEYLPALKSFFAEMYGVEKPRLGPPSGEG